MKKLLFCTVLFSLPVILCAQQRPDTLRFKDADGHEHYKITSYYPGGAVRSEGFYSGKIGSPSKEDAFMRGVKVEGIEVQMSTFFGVKNQIPSLDSARFYSVDGVLQERKVSSPSGGITYIYEYDEEGRLGWIIQKESGRPVQYLALGKLIFFDRRQIVEGRIGETVTVDIPIAIKGRDNFKLKLSSSSKWVKTLHQRTFDPERDSSLSLAITFPATIKEEYLKMEDESGGSFSFPITIIGYDLFSHDFEASDLSEVVFPMDGRKQLVIKADESKLIRLYRDEELIDNYPTGQIRSEIDIKGFRRGQYLVEAVDFRANKKKYCKIRID